MKTFHTLTATAAIIAIPAFSFAQDTSAPNTDIPSVVLEHTTQNFIDSLKGSTPISQLPYDQARQVLIDTQTKGHTAMPDADVKELTLKVGPTDAVKVYTVRPKSTKARPCPAWSTSTEVAGCWAISPPTNG
jgi:acetyl esterase